MTFEALRTEVLKLPEKDRADLAYELIQSLDHERPADPDHERLWQEEIDRRVQAIESGSEELFPAEEVYASVRAALE
jgi:putative addiction module component (TIGR02574 family)